MMQKRVTDLILDSFGTQSYNKAMECLKVLRAESIKVSIVSKLTTCTVRYLCDCHSRCL